MDVVSVSIPAREKGKDAEEKTVYEDVQLTECIDHMLEPEGLEYACPACQRTVDAIKQVFCSLWIHNLVLIRFAF